MQFCGFKSIFTDMLNIGVPPSFRYLDSDINKYKLCDLGRSFNFGGFHICKGDVLVSQEKWTQSGTVACACVAAIREAEAGGFLEPRSSRPVWAAQ